VQAPDSVGASRGSNVFWRAGLSGCTTSFPLLARTECGAYFDVPPPPPVDAAGEFAGSGVRASGLV
jgi:hypothetical protein